VWRDGRWGLEMKRRLQTGHPDDVQFDVTRTYRFGIAVMDNAGGFEAYGKGHSFDLGAKTLEFGGLGSEEVTQLVLIKDYLTSAKAHIKRGEAGLAISELNNGLTLFNEIRDRVASLDPALYATIRDGFVKEKRTPTVEGIESLEDQINNAILTFQGKRKPKEATLYLKMMIVWGKIQLYIFILLAFLVLPLFIRIWQTTKKPYFHKLGLFLAIIITPILLEGMGRLGILLNISFLQNFSFMTNEQATILWAFLMIAGLIMARYGFQEVDKNVESLEDLSSELEQKVRERTKEIKETRDYLRTLISSMNDGLMVINKDYVITDVNPIACKMAGLSKEEMVGRNCYNVSHNLNEPCKPPHGECPVKRVYETGKSHRAIHEHFNKDGKSIYIEISASPILDEEGRVSEVLEVTRDITERIEMEKKLKEYSEELEEKVRARTRVLREHMEELALLQKANNAINKSMPLEEVLKIIVEGMTSSFKYEASGITLLSEDRKYLHSIAISADSELISKLEKFTGMTFKDYKIPLFEGSIHRRVVEKKESLITEDIAKIFEHFTDDERLKPLAMGAARISGFKSAIGVPLTAGDKVIGIIGVASKRKLKSQDLERLERIASQAGLAIEKARLEKEIKESEERYYNLIESANDGIFVVDEKGNYIMVNRRACEMTGYSREELLKMNMKDLIVDSQPENSAERHPSSQEGGRYPVVEIKMKRKDGEVITVEQSTAPITVGGKKLLQAIARDVTERKKFEKEKAKLEQQLYQTDKLASVGLLAAGVAHGINNPLTAISLNTEVLMSRVKDEEIKEKLRTIEEQVNIAASIVKNLLDFSREMKPEVRTIDLNEILQKDLETLSFHLKGIDVSKNFNKIPKIIGDASQLHQVFMNIIINAIQAMPDGGKLTISTEREDSYVVVTISDTGVGIAKEHLPKIFDPFFTTKEVGEGTGLGLSICHGIVKEHGGSIEVESEVGKGSTFRVKLPVGGKNGKDTNHRR
jgi:PAS domain S-box-containing protein